MGRVTVEQAVQACVLGNEVADISTVKLGMSCFELPAFRKSRKRDISLLSSTARAVKQTNNKDSKA